MKLFAYGELCKPPVLLEVLGRVPCAEPGVLHGYHRELNPDTGFFRVVRRPGARVVGLVLEGLDETDLLTLDRYENVSGGEYDRVEVEIRPLGSEIGEVAFVYAAG